MKKDPTEWPKGIKKTKQRQCVFSILQDADKPLSATEIYQKAEQQHCEIWLSTVYRVLDLLVDEQIVIKTTLTNRDTALYELDDTPHKHYAVCLKCHKLIEMNKCPAEHFDPELQDSGFHVTGHKFEIYGYCKDCFKKQEK